MSVTLKARPDGAGPAPPARRPNVPDAFVERRLLARYHSTGDLRARDELVNRLMPLVRHLALRYSHRNEPVEDLVQVASLGLLKAIDRFEPGRGVKLTSFAVPTILGELKRHFRDTGWAVHVPRDLKELVLKVTTATESLSAELGRSPTVGEIAAEVGCSPERVLEAAEATTAYRAASLDATGSDPGGPPVPLVELIGATDDGYELSATRQAIAEAWSGLTALEREMIGLRFGEGLTQREIGERVGLSQMQVSRLLRRALALMTAGTCAA